MDKILTTTEWKYDPSVSIYALIGHGFRALRKFMKREKTPIHQEV